MTTISPLLKSRLESNKSLEHKYHTIPTDIKPNEPKAKLIKENFLQSAVSSVGDVFQDGKNFFKAAKTGKLNDNSLGRINDLGMKAGALIIASFLALHAKTKTDAIMKFLGGATFFASMSLWPKLFINLPARLAHGFRIDHRYLSAQGDKKDLGLDNQFQPMDIFTDEEMMKMAKNAGIDPNDKFAREKMQRKLQKTMLQNRTLWMATAGFATPLMTSLIGDAVTPKVHEAVIKSGIKKVEGILGDEAKFKNYLANAKPSVKNQAEIQELFKGMDKAVLDDDFYKQLSVLLDLNNLFKDFKDPDDMKPLLTFSSENLAGILKELREQNASVDKESLIKAVSDLSVGGAKVRKVGAVKQIFGESAARELFRGEGDKISLDVVRGRLAGSGKFNEKQIEELVGGLEADNSKFFEIISSFNSKTIANLRGRLKAYMDLFNPIFGSKAESATTGEYEEAMEKLFDVLNIKDKKELDFLKKEGEGEKLVEFLSTKMQELAVPKVKDPGNTAEELRNIIREFNANGQDRTKLKEALTNLFGSDFYLVKNQDEFNNFAQYINQGNETWEKEIVSTHLRSNVAKLFIQDKPKYAVSDTAKELLGDDKIIAQIGEVSDDIKPATKEGLVSRLLGNNQAQGGIFHQIRNFVAQKQTDSNAIKLRPVIAANFEARAALGEFGDLTPEQLKVLRNFVYNDSFALRQNPDTDLGKGFVKEICDRIYNPSAFKEEEQHFPGISQIVQNMKSEVVLGGQKEYTQRHLRLSNFINLVKNKGTEIYNNKAWKRIFFPMAVALVAITLLVQPLFGKIDKEFPKQEEKKGGTK